MSGTECKLEKLKKQVKRIIGNEVSDMGINKDYSLRYTLTSNVKKMQLAAFGLGFSCAAILMAAGLIVNLYLR